MQELASPKKKSPTNGQEFDLTSSANSKRVIESLEDLKADKERAKERAEDLLTAFQEVDEEKKKEEK